jgi:acylphosphatase
MKERKRSFIAFVRGRVQGVYFRDYVRTKALGLGLAGYCRNGEDGVSVEVLAEGDTQALELLVEHLHRGPPRSRIDSVDLSWDEAAGDATSFVIRW